LFAIGGCGVVISHDRSLPARIATHILAFEGESKVTFFDGNFSEYEEWGAQTLGDAATQPHGISHWKLTRYIEDGVGLIRRRP
jgi:energy-dependent translational throttle protein EttA